MHARLNIARQIELSSAADCHGTEQYFILKNHTKSKLDCNILNSKSPKIEYCTM